ncbi:hypothetical protein FOMPIDRAFT_1023592 [Fomitopsis schrenkii]|uniref:Uncharacterized protein n=1 Tax=Fomitopsis schrenkii TaxID=2126942 RepID=S8ECA2_FOMSC|nr:hypothetical protein FOMPIDRAFT_1023592 [Fomitopsis schrenkii]
MHPHARNTPALSRPVFHSQLQRTIHASNRPMRATLPTSRKPANPECPDHCRR